MPRGVGVRVPLSALIQDEQRKLFVFFLCADKGTRTDCGGSADLSAMIDCASCDATTNIGDHPKIPVGE